MNKEPEALELLHIGIDDRLWLEKFGFDQSRLTDANSREGLNVLVEVGSQHVNDVNRLYSGDQIIRAREDFLSLLGIRTVVEKFRNKNPSLMPLSTFISTQRVMASLGLDGFELVTARPTTLGTSADSLMETVEILNEFDLNAQKILRLRPTLIGYSKGMIESIVNNLLNHGVVLRAMEESPSLLTVDSSLFNDRFQNLADRGFNAARIVNLQSSVITSSSEVITSRIDNLKSHDFNVQKIVNTNPSLLSLAEDTLNDRLNNLKSHGLDIKKVVEAQPTLLNCSVETINDKIKFFESLGLKAIEIINRSPSTLGFGLESIEKKFRMLERSARVLGWKYGAAELIEASPQVLGYSMKKLQILRRVAAKYGSYETRSLDPVGLRLGMIIPLEKYLIAIGDSPKDISCGQRTLIRRAGNVKLTADARKNKATELSLGGALGRIGVMYLDYINYAAS